MSARDTSPREFLSFNGRNGRGIKIGHAPSTGETAIILGFLRCVELSVVRDRWEYFLLEIDHLHEKFGVY